MKLFKRTESRPNNFGGAYKHYELIIADQMDDIATPNTIEIAVKAIRVVVWSPERFVDVYAVTGDKETTLIATNKFPKDPTALKITLLHHDIEVIR